MNIGKIANALIGWWGLDTGNRDVVAFQGRKVLQKKGRLRMERLDPLTVANQFLELAEQHSEKLTHLKLQKLIYFAHGWHLAMHEKPLINETVEAWKHGPVVSSVYHEFKKFGAGVITEKAIREETPEWVEYYRVPSQRETELQVIEMVYNAYSKYDGLQLSAAAHQPDTPWRKTVDACIKKYGALLQSIDIDNDDIAEHFKQHLAV